MDRQTEPTLSVTTVGFDGDTDHGRFMGFFIGADDFRTAAKLIRRKAPAASAACYMLTFHAIELVLKAKLAGDGVTNRDMRIRYGHKLVALYEEVSSRRLILPDDDERGLLEWADEYHDVRDGVRIRYDFFKTELPFVERYFAVLDRIRHYEACKKPVHRGTQTAALGAPQGSAT